MTPILGGMFGLAEPSAARAGRRPGFLSLDDALFLANARSGLRVLVDRLQPPRVFLPSYLCDSLVAATRDAAARTVFYAVDQALVPRASDLSGFGRGDLVVAIGYFGFPAAPAIGCSARLAGAWLLEDKSQALLSTAADLGADFVLLSPRKFVGVPDGGILASRCAVRVGDVPTQPAPFAWWQTSLEAAVRRARYDRAGGDRQWFDLFREAERTCPIGSYAMSATSRHLLESAFDYGDVARRRVANYAALLRRLGGRALFPSLPPGVVPLGFPVKLAHRDRVRSALFAEGIYPPVHWDLAGHVPAEFQDSHALSAQTLTLPCDQRAGEDDMARLAALVEAHEAGAGLSA
jgi:hypothetical protein